MKKIVFVILDGAGDHPCPEINGKTPLEAAKTPNLDKLAQGGATGILYPIGKGIAPESDSAAISLLGYDVMRLYTGRGPLEVFGAGLGMKDGDLALRVNFATMGPDNALISRRCRDLSEEEAGELKDAINKGVKLPGATFTFQNFRNHRGSLLIRKKKGALSGNISNLDPGYKKVGAFGVANKRINPLLKPCVPLDGSKGAYDAAILVNEFVAGSRRVLEAHAVNQKRAKEGKKKANILIVRDAGDRLPKFEDINKKYGVRFGIFGEMACEIGLGMLMGMRIIKAKTKKGAPAKDKYKKLAARAAAELKGLDVIYLHLKGPDDAGHAGDVQKKIEAIELIDKHFLGSLLPALKKETLIVVTCDHATPCRLKIHSADPVPLMIFGPGVKKDGSRAFNEKSCFGGSLGAIKGIDLMQKALRLAR